MRTLVVPAALAVLLGAGLATGVAQPAAADVDDFRFSSMTADYTLSTDDDGRSKLRTVETLTAEFPSSDQNHGIRRTLVDSFDGHPTDLHVVSVTDASGKARSFDVDDEDGETAVTVRAGNFVHGTQVYVITYEQSNVTLQRTSSGNDEFYWDVNGTDWAQPFDRVDATLTVSRSLADDLTDDLIAVSGRQGATDPADIRRSSETTVTASATDLSAHETLTMAVGFRVGTFTPRDGSLLAAPWPLLSLGGGLLALLALVGAIVARRGPLRNAPGRPAVVARYDPPPGIGIPFAASFLSKPALAAELLALAVSGRLQVVEKPGAKKPAFALRLVDPAGASDDDLVYLRSLFGDALVPGTEREISSRDRKGLASIATFTRGLPARAVEAGLRRPYDRRRIGAVVAASTIGSLVAIVFGILSLVGVVGGPLPVVALVLGFVLLVVAPIIVVTRPLTKAGAELRDDLAGLRLYVATAEADRLRFAQSPEGADRVPGAQERRPADPGSASAGASASSPDRLRLTEELLPWAVLFGEQKRWSAELGRLYERQGAQPGWYSGGTAFNPVLFSASVTGFTASSVSAFSSSTGGSTGGAVAGGGGGGGGGGGV